MTTFVPQLPLRLQPKQSDHGETSLLVDAAGFTVASINSAAWDIDAPLTHPQDRAYANFIMDAAAAHQTGRNALAALADMVGLAEEAIALRKSSDDPQDAEMIPVYEAQLTNARSVLLEAKNSPARHV